MSVRSKGRYFSIRIALSFAISSPTFFRASARLLSAKAPKTHDFGRTASSFINHAHPKSPFCPRMSSNGGDKIVAPTGKTPTHQYSEMEVEKKFPVPENTAEFSNLKETLSSIGFQVTHEEEFVDWYFDLPDPNWHFTLNDIWIRYREKKWKMDKNTWGWRGGWEVKLGDANVDGGASRDFGGITIFQEYHGVSAKDLILELVLSLDKDKISQGLVESTVLLPSLKFYDGHDIPHLDGAEVLVPFSMFKTFRTCWKVPSSDTGNAFSGLKVDIDRTDFGFAVGEVEACFPSGCNDSTVVESGKEKIHVLVELLTTGPHKRPAGEENESISTKLSMGKLEYYLKNNNKRHYEACRRAGVM